MTQPSQDFSPGWYMGLGDTPQEAPIRDLMKRAAGIGGASPWQVIQSWLEIKPPFAQWFLKGEQTTLAGNAGRTLITGFRIPDSCYGVLRWLANGTSNAADSPSIRFALERDGSPVPGFARIIGKISVAMNQPRPMMEPMLSGQIIAVIAQNLSTVSVSGVAGSISGWYWPTALR